MTMDFEIIYYQDNSGKRPVEEFLIELKISNRSLAAQAFKGIEKLRSRDYHKEPLSKHLESDLFELRIRSKNNILRIIYTFSKRRVIILLHVFIKKQQKTPTNELEIARNRLKRVRE